MNSTEMFAALNKQSIDLVILDVILQNEDGFSVCRQLRTTSQIPVILISAAMVVVALTIGLFGPRTRGLALEQI
jgi:two-component system, OmpR family, response regulator